MRSFFRLMKLALLFAVMLILVPHSSFARSRQAQCLDVAGRGNLNVLTINLLFTEMEDRESRLEKIADFIIQKTNAGKPVDIVMLQEVVGGAWPGTMNSSLDLQKLLTTGGIRYNLSYTLANGVPGILTVGNAILSRCEIIATLFKILPFESEEIFQGLEVRLKRKVLMSRIDVPGSGEINLYNTHLCSYCDPGNRLEQARELMKFIKDVEKLIPGDNPILLGGDFNTDLTVPDDLPVYNLITQDNHFVDSYAAAHACSDCCSANQGYDGCTYGVPGNPYAINPFTGQQEPPGRIDYLFEKGMGIESSAVVFRSGSCWVSDHSGVLTKFRLP